MKIVIVPSLLDKSVGAFKKLSLKYKKILKSLGVCYQKAEFILCINFI